MSTQDIRKLLLESQENYRRLKRKYEEVRELLAKERRERREVGYQIF